MRKVHATIGTYETAWKAYVKPLYIDWLEREIEATLTPSDPARLNKQKQTYRNFIRGKRK